MDLVLRIISDLNQELSRGTGLSEDAIGKAVAESAIKVFQEQGISIIQKPTTPHEKVIDWKNLEVSVEDGDEIPEHNLEGLKKLIRKVALRKLKALEEQMGKQEESSRK